MTPTNYTAFSRSNSWKITGAGKNEKKTILPIQHTKLRI